MLNERLRRVTDLFVEGIELYMGMAPDNSPIVVWVNKLNSFEAEEARRDGVAARGLRAASLGDDSVECQMVRQMMAGWSEDKLAWLRVDQNGDELYLRALNDLETDEKWRENLELVRRGSQLLDDAGAGEDDPRRAEVTQLRKDYLAAVDEAQTRVRNEAYRDMIQNARKDNEADYIEAWRNEATIDSFIAERRVTELFRVLRDCKAKVQFDAENPAKMLFDHEACDHSVLICSDRAEVRALPESLIERALEKLDEITVGARDSGNSDAPASSSASLGLSSVEEEVSTSSIPEVTSPAAATT